MEATKELLVSTGTGIVNKLQRSALNLIVPLEETVDKCTYLIFAENFIANKVYD